MKFQLILLLIFLARNASSQTTIIPEIETGDGIPSESTETTVSDDTVGDNEVSEAAVPDAIIRDANEHHADASIVYNIPQQPQVHQQQQFQQSQPQQHQWMRHMNHFHPIPYPQGTMYRITTGRRHHAQQPQSHRSINSQYPYAYAAQQQQQRQAQPQVPTAQPDGCQGTTKRNVDENELTKNFESWFLNAANHDILFSICGTLLPGHRILIEARSTEFANWIQKQLEKSEDKKTISIQSIGDLITDNDDNNLDSEIDSCPNHDLLEAFKIFLHYFYSGTNAFDSINDINVSLLVFQMVKEFFSENFAEEHVEPKIIESMKIDNLNHVYRYWRKNNLNSLKLKWSKFIADHSSVLNQNIPFTCDEVINNVEMFDHYLESLNTTQTEIIKLIQHYLENCPEQIKETIKDATSLPNSLYFYRCTIDDLKQLRSINFISYEILAEELENRLRAKERVCNELRKNLNADSQIHNYFRQMEPYLGAFRRSA